MLPKMGGVGLTTCAVLLFCVLNTANSYSKYGRGCQDIGCLPNEECVITSDSCSYSQREGKECGNYPTCKKKSSDTSSAPVNPSGSSIKPGPENTIFSPGSSNPALNNHAYISQNGNGGASTATGVGINNGYNHKTNGANGGITNNQNGRPNPSAIDPHYVFGAPQSVPVIPNLPIFPFNSPTQAPSFQQFPQPNHPGSVLNPGYPHGLQPVNPYNPPFVFGQQPFYSAPGGTGGPPGGSNGILGGSGGGLAPYGSYGNPNMYNKPPPQYQNQNPYNRQTQSYPSSAARFGGAIDKWLSFAVVTIGCAVLVVLSQQFLYRHST